MGTGKPEVRRRAAGIRLDQTLKDAAAFAWPAVPQQSVSKVNPSRDRTWFQSRGPAKTDSGLAIPAKFGVYGTKVVRPSPVPGFQRLGAAVACDGLLAEAVCLQDRSEGSAGIGLDRPLRGVLPSRPDGGRGVRLHPVEVHRGQGRPCGVLRRAILAGRQKGE